MADLGAYGDKRLSLLALLGFLVGIVSVGALFVAAYGYREGWWEYPFALLTILKYATYGGLGATVISLIGLGAVLPGGTRRGLLIALIGLIAGGGASGYVLQQYYIVKTVPFIHDISTDTDNPPDFIAVLPARESYGAARGEEMNALDYSPEVALQQRAGYPNLGALVVSAPPASVFEKVEALAEAMEWEIVAADAATGRLEATATTRFFQFKDDIVVRLTASGEGTRIDVRSVSRVGRSDVGVNAARIAEFLAALERATS
jgi:uncharacterized protein (DUF1499 family)